MKVDGEEVEENTIHFKLPGHLLYHNYLV